MRDLFKRCFVAGEEMPAVAKAVVLIAYVALVATVAAHHEPWRDEADPWLLARDAGLFDFLHHMGLSGTPGLWHLVLVPFARAGLPYASQAVLHVLIAACTAALLLWRAPFAPAVRVALVFSFYFAFEYAVVVRSYALGVLLLFAIAAKYRSRFEHPVAWGLLVALLANVNTHSLIIAAMIGLGYLVEGLGQLERRRAILIGASIMAAGGLAAAVQLYPPPDAIARGLIMRFTPNAAAMAVSAAFFPTLPFRGSVVLGAIVIAVTAYSLRRARIPLFVLSGCYAGLAYVYTYKWIGGLRHAGFVLLVMLYSLWTAAVDRDQDDDRWHAIGALILTATLVVSIYATVVAARLDIGYAYSGAQEMAAFVRHENLEPLPIAAHSETTTSALAPWLKKPLWYPGSSRYGTFNLWDQTFERGLEMPYPAAVAAAQRQFAGRDYLLLLNVEMPDPAANGFALIHHTTDLVFGHPDERFWLYRPLHR